MGKVKFSCGDLVVSDAGYDNGISLYFWCKVLDIVVDHESHESYIIVTGHGDMNTKAKLRLKPIGSSRGSFWSPEAPIEPIEKDIFETENTHGLHLIKTTLMKSGYDLLIKNANNKMNFILSNRNRNEKLEDILN